MSQSPPRRSDYQTSTIRAVAVAYRSRMNAGKCETIASRAAVRAYLRHHPEATRDEAGGSIYRIINLVVAAHGAWFNSRRPPYRKVLPDEAYVDDLPEV